MKKGSKFYEFVIGPITQTEKNARPGLTTLQNGAGSKGSPAPLPWPCFQCKDRWAKKLPLMDSDHWFWSSFWSLISIWHVWVSTRTRTNSQRLGTIRTLSPPIKIWRKPYCTCCKITTDFGCPTMSMFAANWRETLTCWPLLRCSIWEAEQIILKSNSHF